MRSRPEDIAEGDVRVRVLVVDPDLRVLSALEAAIGSEPDLAVLAAVPDASALLAAAGLPASGVALIDVSPPGDHGLALVHRLSRRSGWLVVAMSIRSSSRQAADDAGAFTFVVKGDDVDTLLRAIRLASPLA